MTRRRGAVAAAVVGVVGAATVGAFVLGASGSTGTGAVVPAGLNAAGAVAEVTGMTSNVTRMNGGATKQVGRAIGKVLVAKGYAQNIRVAVAWLNPLDADKVLNNPHAQLEIALYRPVALLGAGCSESGAVVVDDGGTSLCTVPDTDATGSYSVSDGSLFLAQTILSGYLRPSVSGSGGLADCAAGVGGTTWCQPALALAGADQRALYVVASITIPGGVPHGQQNQAGSLDFFLKVSRVS